MPAMAGASLSGLPMLAAMAASDPDPRGLKPGDAFGEYVIDGQLGEGGMGIVFRAIREDGDVGGAEGDQARAGGDERTARRFAREARAAGEVDHPHLIDGARRRATSTASATWRCATCPGKSLDDRIQANGPLPVEDTMRVVAEIASALDALHAAGLVHRDVKPSNILLDDERGALLTDFGLAKRRDYSMLTAPGQMLGTLDYIAPEMLRGEEPGPSADLYALGCVVYECLAGKPPFGGLSMFEVGMAHLGDEPADPCAERADAPPTLSEVMLRALAKEPSQRPPTATGYAEMLIGAAAIGLGSRHGPPRHHLGPARRPPHRGGPRAGHRAGERRRRDRRRRALAPSLRRATGRGGPRGRGPRVAQRDPRRRDPDRRADARAPRRRGHGGR